MLGRYRITGVVGAGSFATVYRGEDDHLDVPVAIKVLAEKWSTDGDVRARFLTEARLLRRLGGERIVRVYDIGTTSPANRISSWIWQTAAPSTLCASSPWHPVWHCASAPRHVVRSMICIATILFIGT